MCGICGIVSSEKIDEGLLRSMCKVLAHRGPDDEGVYLGQGIGLGSRRLSIIDLKSGRQPIHNEDKSIRLVLNGEIYNFRELKKDLEKSGHRFYTQADTEVIVHLYEDHGVDCLKFLRGMFAFAVWDEKKRRLFLARDRVGKKPLVYTRQNGEFIFGSELKAILQHPRVKREIEPNAVELYLTYQYIQSPHTN